MRGVLLTLQGLRKLEMAKQQVEEDENDAKRLTLDSLTTRTGLDSHTLCKIFNRTTRVDRRSLVRCFLAFSLLLESVDYELSAVSLSMKRDDQKFESPADQTLATAEAKDLTSCLTSITNPGLPIQPCDAGAAPDVSIFHGRTEELATLNQWIRVDRCRLIALFGQGGIGKTWLAAKLVEQVQVQDDFDYVFWRSLHLAPSITELLTHFIQLVSGQKVTAVSTPIHQLMAQAMDYLRSFRCLIVLDNLETILQICDAAAGKRFAGHYRSAHGEYRVFLQQVTETPHQSSVVLTGREFPHHIRHGFSHGLPTQSLYVKGLHVAQVQKILQHQGGFQGTLTDWIRLTHRYSGNPWILQRVGSSIHRLFAGNLAAFLSQDIVIFDEICDLLHQQYERLSNPEIALMMALAAQSRPVSFAEIRSQMFGLISNQILLEGLNSLEMRSLLEVRNGSFSLSPLLVGYVRNQYITANL